MFLGRYHPSIILAIPNSRVALVTSTKLPYTDSMAIDLHAYLELYLKTSYDLLSEILNSIRRLAQDHENPELLSQTHRNAHSLKSQSLVMGYRQIGRASQVLETIFYHAKSHPEVLSQGLMDDIQRLLDHLEKALTAIGGNHGEPDLSPIINRLEKQFTRSITP